jgi:hypothetical protein
MLIISYIAAFLLSGLVNLLSLALLIPMKSLISANQRLMPPIYLLIAFVGGFGSVWAFVQLASGTTLQATYFMFLIPAVLQMTNDYRRVLRAKSGGSPAKVILANTGEEDRYDHAIDVRAEQSSEWGRVAGFLTGMGVMLGDAPFFGLVFSTTRRSFGRKLRCTLFTLHSLNVNVRFYPG